MIHHPAYLILLLAVVMGISDRSDAQPGPFFMKVRVDTTGMSGDPEVIRKVRAGGISLPSGPVNIPLNEHQRATYRKDRNETYLSAVNMMNQVTMTFSGNQPGQHALPSNPSSMPRVRVFLADIQPILDGNLVAGNLEITDFVSGKYVAGKFKGKEKVAGYNLYFTVSGEFRLPLQVR